MRVVVYGISVAVGVFLGWAQETHAQTFCLHDNELRSFTRSVYTKFVGQSIRVCAENHIAIEAKALETGAEFLTNYHREMRENRLATNLAFQRNFPDNWEDTLNKLFKAFTKLGVNDVRNFTVQQCDEAMDDIIGMSNAKDYEKIMSQGRPAKLYDIQRSRFPRCEG